MKIKVLLVDDHQIMREGLQSLLEQAEDIEVVAQAANGIEALQQYPECRPDVVVMDLTMPVMGGIEATKKIIKQDYVEPVSDKKLLEEMKEMTNRAGKLAHPVFNNRATAVFPKVEK